MKIKEKVVNFLNAIPLWGYLAVATGILSLGLTASNAIENSRKPRGNLEKKVRIDKEFERGLLELSKEQEKINYQLPLEKYTEPVPKPKPIEMPKPNPELFKWVPKTIVLDPGHGMDNRTKGLYDPGAVSGEYKEAELVLAQAKKVKEYLEAKGYIVYLTRKNSSDSTPLRSRTSFANGKKADVLVSLHYNAAESTSANGTEVLYSTEEGKKLAELIQSKLVKAIGTTNRGVKPRPGLRVLKGSTPAVIVETAFISNEEDRKKASGYADEKAIAEAIHTYTIRGK